MPHDPKNIKLRAGAATPINVKLYPWTSSGSLSITELDSGQGTDILRISHKVRPPVSDLGSGFEHIGVVKSSQLVQVTDTGSGIDVTLIGAPEFYKELRTPLEASIGHNKVTWPFSATLRVHATIIDEGRLSIVGSPARLIQGYVYPVGYVSNLRVVQANEWASVSPRLNSVCKYPVGWQHGHRSWIIELYTLGRSTVLDGFVDEDGDSEEFELLDIQCLDKNGDPSNIFAEECVVADVEAVFHDVEDVVYRYTVRCGKFSQTPTMHVLKMTMKPVSSPLTITLIHPHIWQPASQLSILEEHDLESTWISSSILRRETSASNIELSITVSAAVIIS